MSVRGVCGGVVLALLGIAACNPQQAAAQDQSEAAVMSPRVVAAQPVKDVPSAEDPQGATAGAATLQYFDLTLEDGPLTEQLTVQAGKAIRAGKRPFVEMRAGWCPICKRVDRYLLGETLGRELSDVVVIRVDTDVFGDELAGAGLTSKTIPAFYEIDRRGTPTDHWVNGHRWGPKADVPAKLRAFFSEP